MARVRDEQARLEQLHQDRDQMISERSQLQATFDSLMAERRALIDDLRSMAKTNRGRRTRIRPA